MTIETCNSGTLETDELFTQLPHGVDISYIHTKINGRIQMQSIPMGKLIVFSIQPMLTIIEGQYQLTTRQIG